MKAFIMAGGKGTRLLEITKDLIPKPMVKLYDKPMLERSIEALKEYGVDEVYISVGYMHEVIEDYFNSKDLGVKINFIVEDEPLGSGGALYFVKDKIDDDFVVCNGDSLFSINIDKMMEFHKSHNAYATLLTHSNFHPYDSDLLICDTNNRVIELSRKDVERDFYYRNNVNAGFFIINPKALYYFDTLKKASMEHDFINQLILDGKGVYSYKSTEYFKDVGTPERYHQALLDIKNSILDKRNFKNKQKAIFLDRDGTLNKYKGFLKSADDLEIIDGVVDALGLINNSEYLGIIVSNQPVVARGECTMEEQENIFNKLETILGKAGVYVDARYYCPHHPDSGFDGEVKELKIKCNCRKPNIAMLERAVVDFNLDLSECVIIGDTDLDIETGKNANITTIRVLTGKKEDPKVHEDYTFDTLYDAVKFVIDGKHK